MDRRVWMVAALSLLAASPALAKHHHGHGDGLEGATLLLVRHAEKPASGPDLSPAGEERAQEYVKYFSPVASGAVKTFWSKQPPQKLDTLVATEDSANSSRPRLTLTPLSQSINLTIQQPCADKDEKCLADWLEGQPSGRTTLIAWHHGTMPKVLKALGADPDKLLPGGKWPGSHFDWVIELRYNSKGKLTSQHKVDEGSLASDK